jgi:hypothetical protein
MRKQLEKIHNKRCTFTGIVNRFGSKTNYGHPKTTLLLKEIKDNSGKIVTEHLWFDFGKQFEKLNLIVGDVISFDARVTEYIKGYKGYREDIYKPLEIDYRLSNLTKVRKVELSVHQSQLELVSPTS